MLDDVRDMMALMALCEEHECEGISLGYQFIVYSKLPVHEFEITETLNGKSLFKTDSKCVGEVLREVNEFLSDLPVCELCGNALFDGDLTMTDDGREVCPDCFEQTKKDYTECGCDRHHALKEENL